MRKTWINHIGINKNGLTFIYALITASKSYFPSGTIISNLSEKKEEAKENHQDLSRKFNSTFKTKRHRKK